MDVLLEYEEMNVVDSWLTYQFEPYYKKYGILMGSTLSVFVSQDPFRIVNGKLAEMAAFKAYLATNPNKFKPNAHLAQVTKVSDAFRVVEDRLLQYISGLGYPVEKYTVDTNTANFNYDPVVMYGNVAAKVDNYRVAKSPDNADLVLPQSPSTTSPAIIMTPTGDLTTTPTPRGYGSETIVTQTPKPETSSSGGLLLGLGLSAAILFFVLKKKEKKDQK